MTVRRRAMSRCSVLIGGVALHLLLHAAAAMAAEGPSKEAALAGQKEYRRRGGHCMNARVYRPAQREARIPGNLGDTPVLHPRIRERFGKMICYAADDTTLWAADDQTLYRLSGVEGKLIRTYDASDGLPDEIIQCIAPAGTDVWLATLSGLAKLDLRTNRITAVPGIRFTIARLAAGPQDVWLVADTGAYRLRRGKATWEKLPDFPGQPRLAAAVKAGFWWFQWRNREVRLIDAAFANEDGFYVLHERKLWRFDPAAGAWKRVASQAWQAVAHGRTVWVMCTDGVVRYNPVDGASRKYRSGEGPAAGRPTAMAVTDEAFYLAGHGNYNPKARKFTGFAGGGISCLDLKTDRWTITGSINGVDVHFVDALHADGDDVWAAVMLYDGIRQRGAHPGMAHVKQWLPVPAGLGLARCSHGKWSLLTTRQPESEKRWIGPQGTGVHPDAMVPQHIDTICCTDGRVWGAYRLYPSRWYGGYYFSAGCLVVRNEKGWQPRFDVQTGELGLQGEHPTLLGVSRSHGEPWLAEGHLRVLGMVRIAGRCWVVSQAGLCVHDPGTDRFTAVVRAADRLYFRATAAAAGREAVWFGSDGGTVSRLDRKTGRLALIGLVPGRRITGMDIVANGRLRVATERATFMLPVTLRDAVKLPAADVLAFDGKRWSAVAEPVVERKPAYTCGYRNVSPNKARRQINNLVQNGKRLGFIEGVFRPDVLCEDRPAGRLWLATYSGVISVPVPADGGDSREPKETP